MYSLSVNGVHSDNQGFLGFLWLLLLPEVVCVCTVVCDTVATINVCLLMHAYVRGNVHVVTLLVTALSAVL